MPTTHNKNSHGAINLNIKKFLLIVILIGTAPQAWSQGAFRFGSGERAGMWDFSLAAIYQDSESIAGPGDLELDIKDRWGFGFNFGYNFTNHLALSFEFDFISPSYDLDFVDEDGISQTVSHRMDMFNGLLKGTYNLLKGPVTPFIDLSIGFSYTDSNIKDGPTYCWPSWYWGWACSSSSHDDTNLNYGGGLGLRWDINRDMFMRASYSIMKLDISNTSNPEFGTGRLEFGWRY
jgi:opacity protein-like surface antigen